MFFDRLLPSPLPHERVVFYLRRHWFTFAKEVALFVLLLAAPPLLALILGELLPEVLVKLQGGGLISLVLRLTLSLYYFGVWAFFWSAWVDYYLDVWLVTTERVVSLEQKGLFNRTIAELRLSHVQDIKSQSKGLWPTLLHFGSVYVQTAGEEKNFVFYDVPKPYEVAERIMRLVDDWRHRGRNNSKV